MDFSYSREDEAMRAEFRDWLARNRQYAVPAIGPLGDEEDVSWEAALRWHGKLCEGGWLGITWPREYGGRGGTPLQEIICEQELELIEVELRRAVGVVPGHQHRHNDVDHGRPCRWEQI